MSVSFRLWLWRILTLFSFYLTPSHGYRKWGSLNLFKNGPVGFLRLCESPTRVSIFVLYIQVCSLIEQELEIIRRVAPDRELKGCHALSILRIDITAHFNQLLKGLFRESDICCQHEWRLPLFIDVSGFEFT